MSLLLLNSVRVRLKTAKDYYTRLKTRLKTVKDSKKALTALRVTHTTSYSEVRLRTASAHGSMTRMHCCSSVVVATDFAEAVRRRTSE